MGEAGQQPLQLPRRAQAREADTALVGRSGDKLLRGQNVAQVGAASCPRRRQQDRRMPALALRFRTRIELTKINPYVLVRPGQAARLKPGWRKPMPVKIRVNGEPAAGWRINLMPVGDGSFFLYLHAQIRKASGTKVGDAVSLTIEF